MPPSWPIYPGDHHFGEDILGEDAASNVCPSWPLILARVSSPTFHQDTPPSFVPSRSTHLTHIAHTQKHTRRAKMRKSQKIVTTESNSSAAQMTCARACLRRQEEWRSRRARSRSKSSEEQRANTQPEGAACENDAAHSARTRARKRQSRRGTRKAHEFALV